jgi:hypothetical protein
MVARLTPSLTQAALAMFGYMTDLAKVDVDPACTREYHVTGAIFW